MDRLKLFLNHPQFIKYQTVILAGFSILICVILIAFSIVPQSLQLLKTSKEISQKDEKNKFIADKISKLESLNLSNYKKDLNSSLLMLPDDKDIPGVIGQVLSTLNASGLALDTFTFSTQGEASSVLSTYSVKVSVVGDSASLKLFLDKIKQSSRLMRVTNIEINNIGILNRAQAVVELTVYYQPLPAAVGNIDQPVTLLTEKEKELLEKISQFDQNNASLSTESASVSVGKSDPFE